MFQYCLVVVIVCSANPENDQYRRPADPSRPSQIGPQAYLVLDVFSNKVLSTDCGRFRRHAVDYAVFCQYIIGTVWQQGLCNGTMPICLSVPAWAHSSKPAAAGLVLWARWTGDTDRLLHGRCSAAVSDECGQCLVVSIRRNLNPDLSDYYDKTVNFDLWVEVSGISK